jgi:hypothetical protein
MDKQRVGSLIAGDVEADLVLVRVSDSGGGRIWLISSDTLARLNELYDQAAVHQWETHLPQALVSHEFLGIVLWQWLGWVDYGSHYMLVGSTVFLTLIGVVCFGSVTGSMGGRGWSSFRGRSGWCSGPGHGSGHLPSHTCVHAPLLQVAGVMAVVGFNWLLAHLAGVLRSVRHRAVPPDAWARNR